MQQLSPADQILLFTTVPAALFWIFYGAFVPWYKSRIGWAVFSFATFVLAILSLIVWSVTTGERAAEPFRIVVYSGLFLAMTAKLAVAVYEQFSGYNERRKRKDDPHHDDSKPERADTGELTLR